MFTLNRDSFSCGHEKLSGKYDHLSEKWLSNLEVCATWHSFAPLQEPYPVYHRGQTSKSLFLFFIAGISFTS